ncbi:DedA family protein [Cellulosimicrobium sp. NPDC057862]|uniref:DedA family protein n=1 Tax=Cellulosimicrobium sp. NPDC057862 TaxID=3346266 RepID=UPI0036712CD2
MPDALDGAPFAALFGFFFAIAFVRTQATYWIARLVTTWTLDRTRPVKPWVARVHAWLSGRSAARGIETVRRWGVLAVPVSFLATGTKTVVNAAAGVVRMPFGRYLAAMTLGCAIHATIYATVGWAVWTAAFAAATGSPWGVAALVLLVLAAVVGVVVMVRRRGARGSVAAAGSTAALDGNPLALDTDARVQDARDAPRLDR